MVKTTPTQKRHWGDREGQMDEIRAAGVPDPDAPSMSEEIFRRVVLPRIEVCRKAPEPVLAARYEPTLRLLREIHEAIGDRLRIVIIPAEYQVSAPA